MLKDLKKKSSNKGFSLVELIIVIAIMAVLVGILAPQYLRYVEKSREAADLANIEQIKTAMEVAVTDESYHIDYINSFVMLMPDNVMPEAKKPPIPDFVQALQEYMPDYLSVRLKSKKYKEIMNSNGMIELKFKVDNGQPTVVVTPPIPLP